MGIKDESPKLTLKATLANILPQFEQTQRFVNCTAWLIGFWLAKGDSAGEWINNDGVEIEFL